MAELNEVRLRVAAVIKQTPDITNDDIIKQLVNDVMISGCTHEFKTATLAIILDKERMREIIAASRAQQKAETNNAAINNSNDNDDDDNANNSNATEVKEQVNKLIPKSMVEKYNELTLSYNANVNQIKKQAEQELDSLLKQDVDYRELLRAHDGIAKAIEDISCSSPCPEKHADAHTALLNYHAAVQDEMKKHKYQTYFQLTNLINSIKEPQPIQSMSDIEADRALCMPILRKYLCDIVYDGDKIISARIKTGISNKLVLSELLSNIAHGSSVLGLYLKVDYAPDLCVFGLRTILSYLGFNTDNGVYYIRLDTTNTMRFYKCETSSDTYSTDPTYAHDANNFKRVKLIK